MEERKSGLPQANGNAHSRFPPVNKNVIVVTPTYRCLGFRDADGIWRHAIGKEEINNVTAWEPVDKHSTN